MFFAQTLMNRHLPTKPCSIFHLPFSLLFSALFLHHYFRLTALAPMGIRILENTVFPTLMTGINELETSFLIFVENTDAADSSKQYSVDLRTTSTDAPVTLILPTSTTLLCTIFLSGNLACLATMVGKYGFEGYILVQLV